MCISHRICVIKHFRLPQILMSLQGPSHYNYVEQQQHLSGPAIPVGYINLPGEQNSPTFDKTLYMQTQIMPSILHY